MTDESNASRQAQIERLKGKIERALRMKPLTETIMLGIQKNRAKLLRLQESKGMRRRRRGRQRERLSQEVDQTPANHPSVIDRTEWPSPGSILQ